MFEVYVNKEVYEDFMKILFTNKHPLYNLFGPLTCQSFDKRQKCLFSHKSFVIL